MNLIYKIIELSVLLMLINDLAVKKFFLKENHQLLHIK